MSGLSKLFLAIVTAIVVTPFLFATVFWTRMFRWLLDAVCNDAFCRIGVMFMTVITILCVVGIVAFWFFGRLTASRDEQKSLS
jgi:uncharacterized membrane protein YeiH